MGGTDSPIIAERALEELEKKVFEGDFNSFDDLVDYVIDEYDSRWNHQETSFTDYIYEDLEDLWQEYEDRLEEEIQEEKKKLLDKLKEEIKNILKKPTERGKVNQMTKTEEILDIYKNPLTAKELAKITGKPEPSVRRDLAKGVKDGLWKRIGKKGSRGVKYQKL